MVKLIISKLKIAEIRLLLNYSNLGGVLLALCVRSHVDIIPRIIESVGVFAGNSKCNDSAVCIAYQLIGTHFALDFSPIERIRGGRWFWSWGHLTPA